MKTLQQVFDEAKRRKRFGTRYAQTATQFALGAKIIDRMSPHSIEFSPGADRYECDEQGQYLLDLPPVAA